MKSSRKSSKRSSNSKHKSKSKKVNQKIKKESVKEKSKIPNIIIKVAILFIVSLILQFYFLNPFVVLAYNLSFMLFSFLFLRNIEVVYFLVGIVLMFLIKFEPFSVFFYLISIFMSLMLEFRRKFDSFLNFILTQIIMISFFSALLFLQMIVSTRSFFYLSELMIYGIILPTIIFLLTFSILNFIILSPKHSKDKARDEFYLLTKFFIKFSIKSLIIVIILVIVLHFIFLTYYHSLINKNISYMKNALMKFENELNNSYAFNITYQMQNQTQKGGFIFNERKLKELLDEYYYLSIISLKASVEYVKIKHSCINMTIDDEKINYDSRIFYLLKSIFDKLYINQYAKTIKKSTLDILSPYLCNQTKGKSIKSKTSQYN